MRVESLLISSGVPGQYRDPFSRKRGSKNGYAKGKLLGKALNKCCRVYSPVFSSLREPYKGLPTGIIASSFVCESGEASPRHTYLSLDGGMKHASTFLLFIFFIQNLVFPSVYAEESGSGSSIVDAPITQTGTTLPTEFPVTPMPKVCIHEVLWAGSDLSTADEWVELTAVSPNPNPTTISLDAWTLRSVKDDGSEVIIATLTHTLSSGVYLVLANTAPANSRLALEPGLVTTSMSLPNTKLLLRLRDSLGVLIDEVDDGVGAPFAGSNISGGVKASMERIDCNVPGTQKENWRTSVTSNGFDEGSLMMKGTPGFPNGSSEVISSSASSSKSSISSISSSPSISSEPFIKPQIQEVLPDPVGSDDGEWIKVKNVSNVSLDLAGWELQSGLKKWIFPSSSGSLLGSGQTLLLPAKVTGLALPNAGGQVSLRLMGEIIDTFSYPQSVEGVSFMRGVDGSIMPNCAPWTGGLVVTPTVMISGLLSSDVETVNLQAVSSGGTLTGAQCRWDFGDGYKSESCNPPSHKMKAVGSVSIQLEVRDYCGNTMIQSAMVNVVQKTKNKKEPEVLKACTPMAFSGVAITEFLPAPGDESLEFIELKNYTDKSVNLCGWSIDDQAGGSKPYALDAVSVEAGGYILIPREKSGIALNNDGDSIRLIAPLSSGGTGVLLSMSYNNAPDDFSYALRSDAHWLWTPFISPGSDNRFEEVDLTLGVSPVILKKALPNPKGDDRYGEWVMFENKTMYPQWLNDWKIQSESGVVFKLDGIVLSRKEQRTVDLEDTGFSLRNGSETILLIDPKGQIRSILGWKKAQEAQVIEQFTPGDIQVIEEADTDNTIKNISGLLGVYIYDKHSVLTLIKANKLELQIDSINTQYPYMYADGVDIQMLTLRSGYGYVTNEYDFSRRLEFEAYERDAQRNLRGLWADAETASMVHDQKVMQAMDRRVREEGVVLSMNPPSGIVSSGTVLEVKANVPARIGIEFGSGELVTSSGVVITDGTYRVYAEYMFQTESGAVRSNVLIREYSVMKEFYAPCIKVSEVYASPKAGELEWLELYNKCAQQISLIGWSVDDVVESGSKPMTLGTGSTIAAYQYLILSGAKLDLTLNNGGDSVTIRTPRKTISDSISYPSLKKERAYALLGEAFCLTDKPTIGQANTCEMYQKPKKASKSTSKGVKQGIGTGMKYVFALSDSGSLLNKGIDQKFSQLEGMIMKNDLENSEHQFGTLIQIGVLATALIFLLLILFQRKMRKGCF